MGNVLNRTGYGCALPALINSWRDVFRKASSSSEDNRIFGIATLAAGGSEGAGQHMAGMRWSQTANYGQWNNPAMPNTFGAQLYDLGDPWAPAGEGNRRVMNQTACDQGKCVPALTPDGKQILDCCWPGYTNCTDPTTGNPMKPCTDKYNCSLPIPETGKYGAQCLNWTNTDFLPTMQVVAPDVRQNSPSAIPGNNFMGSIHPRLKKPVGQRLAYAAARLLKQQERGGRTAATGAGAYTGPTISGCSMFSDQLVIKFNRSLLDGEGLLFRKFDDNSTGGWSANPYNDSNSKYHPYRPEPYLPTYDSLGAMVCRVGEGLPGNATTCACQGWNWVALNVSGSPHPELVWYCEDGPGWKPPPSLIASPTQAWGSNPLGMTAPPNMFRSQWAPAGLKPGSDPYSAIVDLSSPFLQGTKPIAVRLAWPLFAGYKGGNADTCCPTRALLDGHGICLPGSCPLYSNASNLPANPFFALIVNGRCLCQAPQDCSF